MEITFDVIFIVIFVSSGLPSADGLDIKNGTFQVLQQHPQLKKCAASVFYENEYVGCRVSDRTGQCQALTHSWGLKQTIEQGYAYAKKVFVQENFKPPHIQSHNSGHLSWKIPVVLNTGSQIDIFMSIPNWHHAPENRDVVTLRLDEEFDRYLFSRGHGITVRIGRKYTTLIESFNNDSTGVIELGHIVGNPLSALASPKEMFTISFLVQSNALAMFVDDKEVATLKLTNHMRITKRFLARPTLSDSIVPYFLHGIKMSCEMNDRM